MSHPHDFKKKWTHTHQTDSRWGAKNECKECEVLVTAISDYCSERQFVKTRIVAQEFDLGSNKASQVLHTLVDRGVLRIHVRTSRQTVFAVV